MKLKVLFVCLGNICRSPAAEGVLRQMAEERGVDDDLIIDSAGIGAWHVGERPDRRMIKHAAERGYNLSMLRARQFREDDFDRFDRIVVMDEENYHDVMARMPYCDRDDQREEYKRKVVRMKDYFVRFKGRDSVPDPYYGDADGFELSLDMIEDGCNGILLLLHKNAII